MTQVPQSIPLVKLRMVREKRLKYSAQIGYPEALIKMIWPIFRGADRELFIVVGLDSRHFPTVINIVSVGNVERTQVHPREVFKPLILSNATSFICIHNHPAGSIEPSNADRDITEILQEAGKKLQIPLVDHLIVTDRPDTFCSFKRNGMIK